MEGKTYIIKRFKNKNHSEWTYLLIFKEHL